MKRILVNVACLVTGIVLAVAAMSLISNRKAEPVVEKPEAVEAPELTQSDSPTSRVVAATENTAEEITPLTPAPADSEEASALSEAEQFRELMDKIFNGKATSEEELAFWEKMRTSDAINHIIAERESSTPLESEEIRGHMNLAQLYVAKILAAPSGPEKGLWGMKAMERWNAVLELDPNHWDAQYSVAFSLSQYPEFLNKTGEAIQEYEKLVIQQRDMEPESNQAKVYLELYRLYQKRGDQANAYDAIQEGLERFPENQQLIEQRNSISSLH